MKKLLFWMAVLIVLMPVNSHAQKAANKTRMVLEVDTEINGVMFAAGSVGRMVDGEVVDLEASKGFTYRGLEFAPSMVMFSKNYIKGASLAYDQKIDGVLYAGDPAPIFFYDNGALERGILAEDFIMDGIPYKAGMSFHHAEAAHAHAAHITSYLDANKDYVIEGISFKRDDTFSEARYGSCYYSVTGTLSKNQILDGMLFKGGDSFTITQENGQWHYSGTLLVETANNDIAFKAGGDYQTVFDRSLKKVLSGLLAEDVKIGKYIYKADTLIKFRKNADTPYEGTLASGVKINGREYKAGTVVELAGNQDILAVKEAP